MARTDELVGLAGPSFVDGGSGGRGGTVGYCRDAPTAAAVFVVECHEASWAEEKAGGACGGCGG
jgi:hypothetical protein